MNEERNPSKRVRQASFPKVSRHSLLQRTFLSRLQRLAALDRYGQTHLPFSGDDARLIKHSLYSVYRDLVEQGCEREARAIVRAAAAMKDPGDVTDRSVG